MIAHNRWHFRVYVLLALLAVPFVALLLLYVATLLTEYRSDIATAPYWEVVQGLCAVVTTGSLVASAAFALAQYSNSRHERHLGIYNEVFNRLMSDEHVLARRWLYAHVKPLREAPVEQCEAFIRDLDDHNHANIKMCLNAFDHLGFLVERGWLDDTKMLGWLRPIVLKTWECLEPLVLFERHRRGEPDYYLHCEYLTERCKRMDKKGSRLAAREINARGPTNWLPKGL